MRFTGSNNPEFVGPPTPFVEKEQVKDQSKAYTWIKKVSEKELESEESLQERTSQFFDMNPKLITEEELEQFKAFATYGIESILKAYSQKENGIRLKLLYAKLQGHSYNTFPLLFHDISHITDGIINKKETLVPPFLQRKEYFEFNNKESFESELYGAMWGSSRPGKEGERNLALYHAKHTDTLATFMNDWFKDNMTRALGENKDLILERARRDGVENPAQFLRDQHREAQRITKKIQENPPQKIIEMLTYVWEHRDNPRVMVDLFFKEVGPYIEGLQKRKTYTPQPRLKH